MDFLSNASYSGYRNHIQKDILQENVKFGQCDWTWHVDSLSGWRNKEPAWDPIGQDNHWEVPKRPRINTRTPPWNRSLNSLLTSPRALEFLSLRTNELSLQPCALNHKPAWYHEKKKSHLVSLHPFILLLLFIFFPLSSCAKLRLPAETSPKLCRASHEPTPTSTTPELLANQRLRRNPLPQRRRTKGNL